MDPIDDQVAALKAQIAMLDAALDAQVAPLKAEIADLRLQIRELRRNRARERTLSKRDKQGRTQAERAALGMEKWQKKSAADRRRDAISSPSTQRYIEAFRLSLSGLSYRKLGEVIPRSDSGSGPLSPQMVSLLVRWGASRLLEMPAHELHEAAIEYWANRPPSVP